MTARRHLRRPAGARGRQRGSVTAWMMVVPVLVLLLGGITVDLWVAASVRTRLAAVADDAAAAGATAVDTGALRRGEVRLDAPVASARAAAAVVGHADAHRVTHRDVRVAGDTVTVALRGEVELTLLRLLGTETIPLAVTGAARVTP